jgi:hypothetical protein
LKDFSSVLAPGDLSFLLHLSQFGGQSLSESWALAICILPYLWQNDSFLIISLVLEAQQKVLAWKKDLI